MSRGTTLVIAALLLAVVVAVVVGLGAGSRQDSPPSAAAKVGRGEDRGAAAAGPAPDERANAPDVRAPDAASLEPAPAHDEESLQAALNRVATYYESDEIIENFLNPDAFGEYRWHTTYMIEKDDGTAVDEIEYLIRNSKLDAATTVLDWGCGMGWLVVQLAKRFGCQATGVNISERQLAHARQLAEEENVQHLVQFDLYPGKELPYGDGSFDIVYSQESLVHAPDKELAFREIYRVLKPGGELSIQDWFADGDNADWRALTRDVDATYNTFLDTMQNTLRIWRELGFADIVVVDLREKLGEAFVKPFDGYPFLRAIEGGAFTVAFLSARKPPG